VLTGDTLFVGDVARPDLAIEKAEGARGIFRSLRDQLLSLDDTVEVWPGHLGGSMCGGPGMDMKTSSTIGYERQHNPTLAIDEEDEFVERALADLGPQPPNFQAIVELNRGPLITDGVEMLALAPRQVEHKRRQGALLIDVRTDEQFDDAHIAGAISDPMLRAGFGSKLAWVADPEQEVVFIGRDDEDGRRAGRLAVAVGIRKLGGYLHGGMTSWRQEKRPVSRIERVAVDTPEPSAFARGILSSELYTFLDESDLTNAYDRWNIILGPWLYSYTYENAWFTRSTMIGARAGLFRTQEFAGGAYAAYRTNFRDVVAGVVREAVIAACLTALMILLFLGSWRSTLIIAISIPLSILSSVIALSFLGETINIMTLGGLALAIAVRLDGGPAFYRQERVGLYGRRFRMVKFRSMCVGADRMLDDLTSDQDGVLFKMRNDPRVTRVGAFLRKYSLDELPQLFNVLMGDKNLVGPQPETPELSGQLALWKWPGRSRTNAPRHRRAHFRPTPRRRPKKPSASIRGLSNAPMPNMERAMTATKPNAPPTMVYSALRRPCNAPCVSASSPLGPGDKESPMADKR